MKFIICLLLSFSIHAEVIYFDHEIKSPATAESLWNGFDRALTDSTNSSLWPSSSSVVGEGLVDGSVIEVTYSMGLFNPTYLYRLSVNSQMRRFSYTTFTGEHPFVGGATIEIKALDDGGSLVSWRGSYDTSEGGFFARRAFSNFERRFFRELRTHLENQ